MGGKKYFGMIGTIGKNLLMTINKLFIRIINSSNEILMTLSQKSTILVF